MTARQAAIAALTHDTLIPLWRTLAGDIVAIFMLHRFADAARGNNGHSLDRLRANLAFLRKHRYHIAALPDLIAEADSTHRRAPTVVFTVDDGYADFASAAAPVFAEFDCPVTVFLVTGAVDGTTWFWWDRVEFAVHRSRQTSVDLEVDGRTMTWKIDSPATRHATIVALTEVMKGVRNEEKERAIGALAAALEVEIPAAPPSQYAAMTWDDVRRLASGNVSFGPHTLTHPMLTQIADDVAEQEIAGSWLRLREQCPGALPVFCYPNGSYTTRDVDIVSRTDMTTAVTTQQRYASPNLFRAPMPADRFGVPRFAYTDAHEQFVQIVAGVERLKMAIRARTSGSHPAVHESSS